MGDCNPIATPLATGADLARIDEPLTQAESEEMEKTPYRSIVGSLMYALNGTRGELGYAVGILSRYLELPEKQHYTAAKRVLRYLKGTLDHGLIYNGNVDNAMRLVGYTDSDWGGDPESH